MMNNVEILNGDIIISNVNLEPKTIGSFLKTVSLSFEDYRKISPFLKYDPSAQRGLKKNGSIKIDREHVRMLAKVMIQGKSLNGEIVLNLRTDGGRENFLYIEEEKKLIISTENQDIFIVDGKHRDGGTLEVEQCGENPPIFFKLVFHEKSYNEERLLFSELNTGRKEVSKSKSLICSQTDRVQFLMEVIDNSCLKGKVDMESDRVFDEKLITFAGLYNTFFSIDGEFRDLDIVNTQSRINAINYFTKFYNELFALRPELNFTDLKQKRSYQETYLTLETRMWFGYAFIARKTINCDWKKELKRIMTANVTQGKTRRDFFSRKNKNIWSSVLDNDGKMKHSQVTRRDVKEIIELHHFQNLVRSS